MDRAPSKPVELGWGAFRADARRWIGRHGMDLWLLVGLWSLYSLAMFVLATGHEAPRRYQDEFLFYALGKNFAQGDGMVWRGAALGLRSPLYPVLLAPAFWFGDSVAAHYTLIHMLNALMMTAVVFPAFLLARLFVGRGMAFIAALLAIVVPAMNYVGVIGTESLGYPVAVAAFAAIILAVATPRPRNWALAIAAILVAMLTRTQFIVFVPILVIGLVLAGVARNPGGRVAYFRSQRPLLVAMGAVFAVGTLLLLLRGRSVVGLYAGIFDGVAPNDVFFWIKAFTADIYLLAGIAPVIAAVGLALHTENRRDPLIGALLAVTFVAALGFLAEVVWFSATNPYNWRTRHIFYERYMFYLGPLFFTCLLVSWGRVSRGAATASAAICVVVVSGFQTDAVLRPFSYDSFGLSLLGWAMEESMWIADNVGLFLGAVAAVIALFYVATTIARHDLARPAWMAVLMLTLGILSISQAKTWSYAIGYSHDSFDTYPRPADFVDRSTSKPVGMIVTSTDSPDMYFAVEFWNRRIVRAFASSRKPIETPVMYSPTCAFDWDRTGLVYSDDCDFVPEVFYFRSPRASMHLKDEIKYLHPSPSLAEITVMEGVAPTRLLALQSGRNVVNGEVGGTLDLVTFLDRPGQLRITLAKRVSPVVMRIGARATRIPPGAQIQVYAPLLANEQRVLVEFRNRRGSPTIVHVLDIEVHTAGESWNTIK